MDQPEPLRVFLSCRFPLSPVAQLCRSVGEAIQLHITPADRPQPLDLMEKVKKQMLACDAALFLLEGDGAEGAPGGATDWIKAEYGIARAMNKLVAVITQSTAPPALFSHDTEWLPISPAPNADLAVKLTSFLYAMKKRIETARAPRYDLAQPPFVRNALKHRVKLHTAGHLRYETEVDITCLSDALSDVQHSIHTNYSVCWPEAASQRPPKVELTASDRAHGLSLEALVHNEQKYTWRINIDPPLQRNERLIYGWRSEFLHYLPLSKAELAPLIASARYPFPDGRVEHHYFINHPTRHLELKLDFDDASLIGPCEALAFVGRSFSTRAIDHQEVARLRDALHTGEFLGGQEVTLTVPEPRFGYLYAILWSLKR